MQANYIAKRLQRPNLAVLYIAENAFSKNLAQGFASTYKELGGEVIESIGVPENPEDFRPYLEELAPFAPAGIYAPLYLLDFSQFIKQLRTDKRFADTLAIGASALLDEQLFELTGDMAEGVILAANPQQTSYEAQYFAALHKVSFGVEPHLFSPYIYDSTAILLNAMRKVYERQKQITGSALRQEIQNTRYTGTTGRIQFERNGDTQRSISIYKVQAREFQKQGVYILNAGKLQRIR